MADRLLNVVNSIDDEEFAEDLIAEIMVLNSKLLKKMDIVDGSLVDIKVNICTSIGEYISETGKNLSEYEDWMVAHASITEKKICILSPKIVKGFSCEDMIKIALHEYTHIFFDYYFGSIEIEWISEGLAIWFSDQTDLEFVDFKDFPKVKTIDTDFYDGGYIYAGIYASYLFEHAGKDKFKNILFGQDDWTKYIDVNFESEALKAYKNRKM